MKNILYHIFKHISTNWIYQADTKRLLFLKGGAHFLCYLNRNSLNSTNEYYADANIGFGDIELMKSNRE